MKKKILKYNFYFFFIISAIFILLRLEILFGSDLEAPFTDDFYYYLTISRNFLNYNLITFDQINTTNGFQPLWFFYLTIINYLIDNNIFFNFIIILTIFILSFFVFINFKKFLISNSYTELQAMLASSFISYLTLFFSKNGMEISLAMFFFSSSLNYFKVNSYIFTIFGFLTFLSRIDFIIFYFFLISHELIFNRKKYIEKFFLKDLMFPLLVFFYFIINLNFFGFPFPESGVAKSLVNELKFNPETFSFLNSKSIGMRFISLLFIINIFGIFFVFSKKFSNFTKVSLVSSIFFFLSNSLRSAWPLWTWHLYFLSISSPLIIVEILRIIKFKKEIFLYVFIGIFFSLAYGHLFLKNLNSTNDHILNTAKKIKNHFNNKNYQVFAMGDMAGKVSYLLNKRLIQLEGLVAGKDMINRIDQEDNLCKVFKDYKVQIYLTAFTEKIDNLYIVQEPSQKSKNMKKMQGKITGEPYKIFTSPNSTLKVLSFNFENGKNKCIY